MAAFSAVQAPDFGLAPVGADLQDTITRLPAPTIDVSALTLLSVGSDQDRACDGQRAGQQPFARTGLVLG